MSKLNMSEKKRLLLVVLCGAASILSVCGCQQSEEVERQKFASLCKDIGVKNRLQHSLHYKSIRYLNYSPDWGYPKLNLPQWNSEYDVSDCGTLCRELVGYDGVHVYTHVAEEAVNLYKTSENYPWKSLTKPGLYEFYPTNVGTCPSVETEKAIEINGKQRDYNYCINARIVEDASEVSAIKRFPLVLVQPVPPLKAPSATKHIAYMEMVTVFSADGSEVFRSLDAGFYMAHGTAHCGAAIDDYQSYLTLLAAER